MPDVDLVFSKEPASPARPGLARFSTAEAPAGVEERSGGRWANPLAGREELAAERAAFSRSWSHVFRRYTQIEEADCGW